MGRDRDPNGFMDLKPLPREPESFSSFFSSAANQKKAKKEKKHHFKSKEDFAEIFMKNNHFLSFEKEPFFI